MNFFKRAIRYCQRQKVRSAFLFLVFTLLSSMALTALSIGHAAAEGTAGMKKTAGASIHIEIDSENTDLYGAGTEDEWGISYQYNGDYITKDVIDAISKVEGVVDYSAENESGYYGAAVDFEYFPGTFNIDYSGYGQPVPYTVTLRSALNTNFLTGTYKLEEGRHLTEEDSFAVLISKELADKNKLSVGDTVTMYSIDTDRKDTFQIVGIYSGTEGTGKEAMMADGIPANRGYIDMNSYQEMWKEATLKTDSLDVYADSADQVEALLETIKSLPQLKGKTFVYTVDTENFDLISNPLSSLQTMVDRAVAVIAVTGAVLVLLLLVLWTRSRKMEAGILMALGRSRAEIVLQLMLENLLLAIPSSVAAYGISVLLADGAGTLLAGQAAGDVAELNVTIHMADMAAVYGAGGFILALAVFAAAMTVIRLKPGEILSQMD